MAEAEEQPRRDPGVAERVTLPAGDRLCIVSASLLLAGGGGGGQHPVNVWVESNDGETRPIATLSPADPIVAVAAQPRVTLDGEFVLRHDAADATVRLLCQIHYADGVVDDAPPARLVEPTVINGVELEPLDDDDEYPEAELSDSDDDDIVHFHVLDLGPPPRDAEEGEEYHPVVEYDVPSEEDEAERYDSDNGEEDADDESLPGKSTNSEANGEESSKKASVPLVAPPAGTIVPDGHFLGPARYAAVENTAGFMRVATAGAGGGHDDEDGKNKEIVVLYRYTRFSRTWSGRRGVEACRRTKLHRLRFAVPRAGDVAGSLAWAGASLGPLVYPALFRRQLQELWTALSAPSAVPPGAARVQVIVDVGILRREDYTPERMDHMRGAMEGKMREEWPEYCHVSMELQLPEPVPDNGKERGDDARTAKRRKVADGEEETEECAVCFDRLEHGLAAWPGCRHVFHGACVEKTLAGSEMCPLCRTKLSDQRVG
ncbi:hypothetical protein QOZ80_8AG0619170 [Eleusine coracana subsp. coracana]|nr:hypothetical protein QOZ80_8AG0619170 [Eleusine coracana subsp. coracana]